MLSAQPQHLQKQNKAFPLSISQFAQSILESISDAFFVLDHEGYPIYLNEQAEYLLQKPRQALLGTNVWEELIDGGQQCYFYSPG